MLTTRDTKTYLLQQRKEKYAQKRMFSAYTGGTEEVRDNINSWLLMKKGYLKKETEGIKMVTKHKIAVWVKHYIDRKTDSSKCRMCGKIGENISHIVSECNQLAPSEYKKIRHDKVAVLPYWQ